MKRKVLLSVLALVVTIAMVAGISFAYFSDTETSNGNTFTAGTLDLKINGDDVNVVAFNVTNMSPGNQPKRSYVLENAGSLSGKLNITSIAVGNFENGIIEPEASAGDVTDPLGELGDVVNIRLVVDYGGDGWISTGDVTLYNGKVSAMPGSIIFNEAMSAGGTVNILALLDWWSTPDDNKAQGDSMTIDLTFELTQNSL